MPRPNHNKRTGQFLGPGLHQSENSLPQCGAGTARKANQDDPCRFRVAHINQPAEIFVFGEQLPVATPSEYEPEGAGP